jgi:hypothetical protein
MVERALTPSLPRWQRCEAGRSTLRASIRDIGDGSDSSRAAIPHRASEIEAGVIEHPRRRQPPRRLAIVISVLVFGLAALIVASGRVGRSALPSGSRSGSDPTAAQAESPRAVFAQDSYMGVACQIPNSLTCDRVGLAVWLRRPATVTATIAGAPPIRLDAPHWTYFVRDHGRDLYVYAGFLQPAHLTTRLGVVPESKWTNSWLGANAPSPLVRFRIDYGHGNIVTTKEHIYLSAGWG